MELCGKCRIVSGSQEVIGSIPICSTITQKKALPHQRRCFFVEEQPLKACFQKGATETKHSLRQQDAFSICRTGAHRITSPPQRTSTLICSTLNFKGLQISGFVTLSFLSDFCRKDNRDVPSSVRQFH